MLNKLFRSTFIALSLSVLAACSSTQDQINDETTGWNAAQLYQSAREDVRNSQWKSARARLSVIENRFPYSSYAQQALIDEAYINWKDDEPKKAVDTINRFLRLYPGHPGVDYMLYLKGLITFTPPSAFLSSYTGQDPSERDPKGLRESYSAFKTLVEHYPNSRYAEDARQRLTWLVATIAQNETNAAEYYYRREGYVAAINRSQEVLRSFNGVAASERALYIMMKSYEALDLPEQANDTRRILEQNYPNSEYPTKGLDKDKSWPDWFSASNWFS